MLEDTKGCRLPKPLSTKIDRAKIWNPETKTWENRTPSDWRGEPKETAYTKKTATSLVPPTPSRMSFYSDGKNAPHVLLLFDIAQCKVDKKYTYANNVGSDRRPWLDRKSGDQNPPPIPSTIEDIREQQKNLNFVIPHNEILARLSKEALFAVAAPYDDSATRLNAHLQKEIIEKILHLNLPVLVKTQNGFKHYTEEMYKADLQEAEKGTPKKFKERLDSSWDEVEQNLHEIIRLQQEALYKVEGEKRLSLSSVFQKTKGNPPPEKSIKQLRDFFLRNEGSLRQPLITEIHNFTEFLAGITPEEISPEKVLIPPSGFGKNFYAWYTPNPLQEIKTGLEEIGLEGNFSTLFHKNLVLTAIDNAYQKKSIKIATPLFIFLFLASLSMFVSGVSYLEKNLSSSCVWSSSSEGDNHCLDYKKNETIGYINIILSASFGFFSFINSTLYNIEKKNKNTGVTEKISSLLRFFLKQEDKKTGHVAIPMSNSALSV